MSSCIRQLEGSPSSVKNNPVRKMGKNMTKEVIKRKF